MPATESRSACTLGVECDNPPNALLTRLDEPGAELIGQIDPPCLVILWRRAYE